MLAHPEQGYPIVKVAGTNGKTSTARIIAALGGAHGLAAGSFTSPQLEAVEDQFGHGVHAMTPGEFADAMGELAPIADLHDRRHSDGLTTFELLTALAFTWFAERTVDLAVVEAGLGGRLDSTNAAVGDVAVLTGVALDHTEHLGGTIGAIAGEKLGILDPGAVLVTGPLHPAAAAVAERRVAEQGASWRRFGADHQPGGVLPAIGGWLLDVETSYTLYTGIHLRLRGRHQVANFTTAVAAAEALLDRELDEAAVREVGAAITAPGRMELLGVDPPFMIDGAHNPSGMAALADALGEEFPTTRWVTVFGAMADKDIEGMLGHLDGFASQVILTAASSPRAMSVDRLGETARRLLSVPVSVRESVVGAVSAAEAAGAAALVTGSIALVGEARMVLRAGGREGR